MRKDIFEELREASEGRIVRRDLKVIVETNNQIDLLRDCDVADWIGKVDYDRALDNGRRDGQRLRLGDERRIADQAGTVACFRDEGKHAIDILGVEFSARKGSCDVYA